VITTVTTVTTVTTIAAMGLAVVLSVAAVITLMVFLVIKELASTSRSPRPLRIAKFVSVGILPLVMAFAVIVIVDIAKIIA